MDILIPAICIALVILALVWYLFHEPVIGKWRVATPGISLTAELKRNGTGDLRISSGWTPVEGITPLVWKKTGANTYEITSTREAEGRAHHPEHFRYVPTGSYQLSSNRKTLTCSISSSHGTLSNVFTLERI
jgi:hypothetical protein